MTTSDETPGQTAIEPALPDQRTLADLLRSVAFAHGPSRFYQLLQLGLPAAVQFWMWGMWRTAGWLVALGAYGVWALLEQRLQAESVGYDLPVIENRPVPRWLTASRAVAGAIGAVVAIGLVLELVTQAMSTVVHCLGCAG